MMTPAPPSPSTAAAQLPTWRPRPSSPARRCGQGGPRGWAVSGCVWPPAVRFTALLRPAGRLPRCTHPPPQWSHRTVPPPPPHLSPPPGAVCNHGLLERHPMRLAPVCCTHLLTLLWPPSPNPPLPPPSPPPPTCLVACPGECQRGCVRLWHHHVGAVHGAAPLRQHAAAEGGGGGGAARAAAALPSR